MLLNARVLKLERDIRDQAKTIRHLEEEIEFLRNCLAPPIIVELKTDHQQSCNPLAHNPLGLTSDQPAQPFAIVEVK